VQHQSSKKSIVREVVWNPPILNWIKRNCDSVAIGIWKSSYLLLWG